MRTPDPTAASSRSLKARIIRPKRVATTGLTLWLLAASQTPASTPPRYPLDLTLDTSGSWLFTANSNRAGVSVVEIHTGRVVGDFSLPEGSFPRRIVTTSGHSFAGDNTATDTRPLTVAVSLEHHHEVALLTLRTAAGGSLELVRSRRVAVDRRPDGLLAGRLGTRDRIFVACRAKGTVLELEISTGRVLRRIPTIEGARHLAWAAPSSTRILVAGRSEIGLLDLATGRLLGRHAIGAGRAINLGGIVVRDKRVLIAHQLKPTEVTIDPQMIVWGLVIANRITGVSLDDLRDGDGRAGREPAPLSSAKTAKRVVYGVEVEASGADEWVVPFDQRHRANGDPGRPALGPTGEILVPSGGTDRLLVIPTPGDGSPWYESTDPLTREVALPSIRVGDRPVAVVSDRRGGLAYVLCSLDDRIDVVDLTARRVVRSLRLGPAPAATPEHLGARVFFDSLRSRDGWYSCHSCHPDGGTSGHRFDTHSDGDGLAKKAPALHGVISTGPWSWVGRFSTLEEQLRSSLKKTMAVDHSPREEDVQNTIAFLGTLRAPRSTPSDTSATDTIGEGLEVFERAGCSSCHGGEQFTSPGLKDVGVFDEYDGRRRYNPPSLRGVRDRFRWLHDGRASTLESVFTKHDPSGQHGKAAQLSPGDLRLLLAYLETL